ncbi:unnamed protein product [Caenorhabditis sp. 36 PRJEB53466]|nr:unnamed protein product [Caenorhabditis sp. 36 PRJEB53466]
MDDLMNRLQMVVSNDDVDRNYVARDFGVNPYRCVLQEVLLERKDMLRSKMNSTALYEHEESSNEIEEILGQFTNPTFPLEEVNTEKDEEWQPLERKYLDGITGIREEMMMKTMALEKDMERAMAHSDEVLRNQRDFRPIDEMDFGNARLCVAKKFEQARQSLRGDAATKILVLRREIEQQGRKRRNFDKNTTDVLANWFHEHRQNPYPTDQEKAELAKQCNIKISQVNNWFGNQRIRTKQQAMKAQEEEEKERAAAAESEAQMMQNSMNEFMGAQNAKSSMQAIVIPARQQSVMENQNGFAQQQHYFQTGGQMSQTDNGDGQQFYTDFDTFGIIPSDPEHFNQMPYLG